LGVGSVSSLGAVKIAHSSGAGWARRLDRFGFAACLGLGVGVGLDFALAGTIPFDTSAYWGASNLAHLYPQVWNTDAVYIYPPPLAMILAPFHVIGWPAFVFAWTLLLFLAVWVAARAWTLPVVVVSGVPALALGSAWPAFGVVLYPVIGNNQPLISAAIVLSFRWPATWAFVLLTKVGPGVGVLWFAFRREWRSLGIAIGATALVATVTFVIAPGAWRDFMTFALGNYATPSPVPVVPIPFLVRLPMSIVLIWWGARTDRAWTVPIAAGWASLALYDWSYLPIWIGALPLWWAGRHPEASSLGRSTVPTALPAAPSLEA
ncbi:MAG: glycosyltransferase family 87 protein, partial [Candidatus Limnocylindrales bacterium]